MGAKTMKASYLVKPGVVELRTVEVPSPGPGQVLIRIEAVGSCGSDTHFFHSGAIGDMVVRGPVILGHEAAGTIVKVGEGVSGDRLNELVAIEPQKPCRSCAHCKSGQYNLCTSMEFYGAWPIDGAFAEYALIESDFAFAVPAGMSAEQAALAEPVSVAVHACRRAGVTAGSSVFVAGAGPIGIMVTQVALAFGASRVVVSDPSEPRRAFVSRIGASEVLDPGKDDTTAYAGGFDAFIDASGNSAAVLGSIPVVRRGGRVVLVGMGADELNLPIAHLQQREIDVLGTFRYVNTWPVALELMASGKVRTDEIVTSRHGLHEVVEALTAAGTDPSAIKAMVFPALTR